MSLSERVRVGAAVAGAGYDTPGPSRTRNSPTLFCRDFITSFQNTFFFCTCSILRSEHARGRRGCVQGARDPPLCAGVRGAARRFRAQHPVRHSFGTYSQPARSRVRSSSIMISLSPASSTTAHLASAAFARASFAPSLAVARRIAKLACTTARAGTTT